MSDLILIKKGTDLELDIESLAFGGMGVAHYNNVVAFVKNAIPGQKVNARITKKRSSYLEARALKVINESPYSVKVECEHFSDCGGCTFQNLDYSQQILAKESQVKEIFYRIGKFSQIQCDPIIPCKEIFNYRNKMEFTFSNHEYVPEIDKDREPVEFVMGLHAPGRWNKVLDISHCYIQSPIANEIMLSIKNLAKKLEPYNIKTHSGFIRNVIIRAGYNTDEIMINIVTGFENKDALKPIVELLIDKYPMIKSIVNNITARKASVSTGEKQVQLYGNEFMLEKLGDYEFMISPESFFQTNTIQAEKLYNIVLQESNLTGKEIVYDLFCGTGSIAIYISKFAKMVYGFELVMSAVQDAMQNAAHNNVKNTWFFAGHVEDIFHENIEAQKLDSPDVIIVDPPRSGLHYKSIDDILGLRPDRIIYVSCNPSTQARDVSLLCEKYYSLKKLIPIDMFPHTPHVENVATLVRNSNDTCN